MPIQIPLAVPRGLKYVPHSIVPSAVIYAELVLPDGCFVTTDKPGSETGLLQIPLKSQAELSCAVQESGSFLECTQSVIMDTIMDLVSRLKRGKYPFGQSVVG